ncbi:MAG: transglutaminase-like domain-containing protein, partial [Methanolobus sp.]|nr:transglutaminase-like domain-containing protein [Methanolobus sp.]
MKFEHILYTFVLLLVLFSSIGGAANETSSKDLVNKTPYYNDTDYVWSSTDWGSSKVFLNMGTEDYTTFVNKELYLEEKTSTPSEIKTAKDRYIDTIMEMDEFKEYSRDRLEETFVLYSEVSSSLVDAGNVKDSSLSFDIVSFDNGDVVKMKMPSATSSYLQKETIGTKALVPNVILTNANCDWSWVQDEIASQTITIHNYGTTTAKGAISIVSLDENKGYVLFYENLGPGQEGTATIPFYVDADLFPTVGAKPISIRVYVQDGDYFYLTSAPTISVPMVEMYNNGPGEIEDPDNGLSLQTDDVSHHDQYEIARRAAIAGDGTISPYNTAATVTSYVNQLMNYDEDYFYIQSTHTASDEFISDNGFHGVCDEYAVMNGAYLRALGVPTRRIGINGTLNNNILTHQFNEFWDGNSWIHADAQANVFDNPRSYVNSGMLVTEVARFYDADDTKSNVDDSPVFTEGRLHTVFDMTYDFPAEVIAR